MIFWKRQNYKGSKKTNGWPWPGSGEKDEYSTVDAEVVKILCYDT